MPLACTVRDCAAPLARHDRTYRCTHNHTFDIARSGYVNLLQPHDKRSLTPGDSPAAVLARRTLLDAGFGEALQSALLTQLDSTLPPHAPIADLGCGDGTFLAAVTTRFATDSYGVDISVPAIDAAAKRHPHLTWIVANADRRLPFTDHSLALVLSIDGRRHPAEFQRVLTPDGQALIAVPASDDLHELRASVLGEAHAIERAESVVSEFSAGFVLEDRVTVRDRRRLDAAALQDLALATYRCARAGEQRSLAALAALDVTTSHEVLRFRRR
jgi:23S rRNA (guanine745-N1)-methyltransferase